MVSRLSHPNAVLNHWQHAVPTQLASWMACLKVSDPNCHVGYKIHHGRRNYKPGNIHSCLKKKHEHGKQIVFEVQARKTN